MLNLIPHDKAHRYLIMDRAYEGDKTRLLAINRGYIPVVPPKRNRKFPWEYDKELYKRRNTVERFFLRIKRFRKIFTRYDKLDIIFSGFILFAMLNILITFAQYEREVITERVRDKMAASRKKGKWVGGRVPMGYRVENKKLTIVEEEARIIQRIFQRFIEVQSPALIAQELNKDGIRTKQGRIWNRQHIYRILSNHTYVGKVNYKNSVCDGEQEAIIA